jgi:hypothetical protein
LGSIRGIFEGIPKKAQKNLIEDLKIKLDKIDDTFLKSLEKEGLEKKAIKNVKDKRARLERFLDSFK